MTKAARRPLASHRPSVPAGPRGGHHACLAKRIRPTGGRRPRRCWPGSSQCYAERRDDARRTPAAGRARQPAEGRGSRSGPPLATGDRRPPPRCSGRVPPPPQLRPARPGDARPGLEIEPALSPDGRAGGYAAGAMNALEIRVRQVDGGSALRRAPGPATQRCPTWSPRRRPSHVQSARGASRSSARSGGRPAGRADRTPTWTAGAPAVP